jgi:predicted nucleic acid-binding protein
VSRVCLDTSAYSHFKRGDKAAVEALTRATWIGVPVVVLGELRTGFLLGAHPDRNEAELARFLANPVVEVLEVDDEAARIYAEIVVAQRRVGKPVPTTDLWIAALAARVGAPVLTYDGDFAVIARVSARVLQ